jgi:hypothetical protein
MCHILIFRSCQGVFLVHDPFVTVQDRLATTRRTIALVLFRELLRSELLPLLEFAPLDSIQSWPENDWNVPRAELSPPSKNGEQPVSD